MPEGFGDRLQRAAIKKGLQSQKEIARASGLNEGAVSRHLRLIGDVVPRADSVKKYCKALDVTYDWLVFGQEQQPKSEEMIGAGALVNVLDTFDWPQTLSIDVIDDVTAMARREALSDAGKMRPRSVWVARLNQLVRASIEVSVASEPKRRAR